MKPTTREELNKLMKPLMQRYGHGAGANLSLLTFVCTGLWSSDPSPKEVSLLAYISSNRLQVPSRLWAEIRRKKGHREIEGTEYPPLLIPLSVL